MDGAQPTVPLGPLGAVLSAPTAYDAAGPMGNGDLLNWRFTWTVPATITFASFR